MTSPITELREKRAAIIQAAAAIEESAKVEKRDLTPEEVETFDKNLDEADAIKTQYEQADAAEKRAGRLGDAVQSLSEPTGRVGNTVSEPGRAPQPEPQVRVTSPVRQLRSYRNEHGVTTANEERSAHRVGMWFHAVNRGSPIQTEAQQWCRDNGVEYRVMLEGTNTAGGYVVPDDLSSTLVVLQDSFGVARQMCQRVPMTSDTLPVPKRSGGPTASWTGEGATITASDASFDQVNLSAKKCATLTRISNELMSDSIINMADFVTNQAAIALAEAEDDAWLNGDGTSTFGGIYGIVSQLEADETLDGVFTAAAGVDTFAELTVADVAGMFSRLPAYAYNGAGPSIVCSTVGRSLGLERLGQAGGGSNVLTMQNGLTTMYSGWPIAISQKMTTSSADLSQNIMLLFGNFEQGCIFGDRQQVSVAILNELYADTDETGIKITERVDIAFHEAGTTTAGGAGAIVGLMGD